MFLIINTTNRFDLEIGLYSDNNFKNIQIETTKQSIDLLPTIQDFLAKNKIDLKNIKAILVNIGPGSYTGARVGVATANALAWSLDIPVYGFKDGELEAEIAKITKNLDKNFSKIALPFYQE